MSMRLNEKRIREHKIARKQREKADAHTICQDLGGDWDGDSGLTFCPAHPNTRTPALSVTNAPNGTLLVHCFAGCTWQEVFAALQKRGLLTGRTNSPPSQRKIHRRTDKDEAERRRRIEGAQRIWDQADPIAGTLGQRYFEARGIFCELPQSLRFHPHCWHRPTAKCVPAVLAEVTIGAKLVGVQRTFLAEPGTKAFGKSSKMMLGRCSGGAVRLSEGDGPLVVTEGIETGLSVLSALSDISPRVWAALGTSGMAGLVLPRQPGELIIAPDGDAPGREAAKKLADRATIAGWQVRIMHCPDGSDWNDLAREVAA